MRPCAARRKIAVHPQRLQELLFLVRQLDGAEPDAVMDGDLVKVVEAVDKR